VAATSLQTFLALLLRGATVPIFVPCTLREFAYSAGQKGRLAVVRHIPKNPSALQKHRYCRTFG
jgi:hypothetical protein